MESYVITLQYIFTFNVEGVTSNGVVLGKLGPTGLRPTFQAKFEKHGIELPLEMFQNGVVPPGLARGIAR
jgi:pilus assembly protein CpaF